MRRFLRAARAALVSLTLASLLAPVTPLAAQSVRIIQRERVAGDSLVERVLTANVADVQRMVSQWRDREQQLVRELRTTSEGDVATRRRLGEELTSLTREAFSLMSAIEARCRDEAVPRPDGYLGVTINQEFSITGAGLRSGLSQVASVEPGSPAQVAGLRSGDRLLAIGGRDASQQLPELGDILIPGRTVVVRVEREGTARELSVVVSRRPEGFGRSCGELEAMMQPLRMAAPGRVFFETPSGADQRRVLVERRTGEMRPLPPEVELRFFTFGPGAEMHASSGFFAGAEFRALDDGWREVLGVKQGVIVNDVASGSVAAQSGLRSGDVITAVDRSPVTSPIGLVQLLGMLEKSEATLSVVRNKERKLLTLNWGVR